MGKEQVMSRTAVVTGGGSGMGEAIGQQLAARGHRVALLDVQGDAARNAAKKLEEQGASALAVQADVSERTDVDGALSEVRRAFGPIEIMVTSAGIEAFQPFLEVSSDSWERMLSVNLTGTFHCLQAAVPDMLAATWGRIVTISSSSAQSGTSRMASYVASKGGVVGLTRALAVELAPHGITVNSIPPGFIDTPMMRRSIESGSVGASMEQLVARTPVRRSGTPDDVAAACAFLCSEDAGYITGQLLGVNGGWYL
jgi:NAD(P)-dependent dehydrogenase (short-subunit alcohol dehydrogenase family)